MIYVDTSVLLCLVTVPSTPEDIRMQERAIDLLSAVESGRVQAAIGEVVLHEFCYVSGSKRLRRLEISELCDLLRTLIDWPGWVFPPGERSIFMRALDILQGNPRLEFSDSIIAARAEALNADLATFDARLARVYSGAIWK